MLEDAESRQGLSALMISSEGRKYIIEKAVVFADFPPWLVAGEECRNTSNHNAQLGWSPPGIACESVAPTPAVMRTNRTRWAGRRRNARGDLSERDHLDILLAPMSHPHAAKHLTCHVYPPDGSEKMRIELHRRRTRGETADCTDSTSTVAFRPSSQTLFPQFTMRTICLRGDVDGPLRKGIFTRALRSARGLLLLGNGASHFLVG